MTVLALYIVVKLTWPVIAYKRCNFNWIYLRGLQLRCLGFYTRMNEKELFKSSLASSAFQRVLRSYPCPKIHCVYIHSLNSQPNPCISSCSPIIKTSHSGSTRIHIIISTSLQMILGGSSLCQQIMMMMTIGPLLSPLHKTEERPINWLMNGGRYHILLLQAFQLFAFLTISPGTVLLKVATSLGSIDPRHWYYSQMSSSKNRFQLRRTVWTSCICVNAFKIRTVQW